MPIPRLLEASSQSLCLESTLEMLPLYHFQVESHYSGSEIVQVLGHHPAVPGVVVQEQGHFLGMLSRQRLLEYLIHSQGWTVFGEQSLAVLYRYVQIEHLVLPRTTPILIAAQQALRRSTHQQGEPIVVQLDAQTYGLLDIHELNVMHWLLRGIETQVRYERIQVQMIQSEKMASLGRLVDGVAHEILDPVGFIWGNLSHVSTYSESLLKLLAAHEALLSCGSEVKGSEAIAAVQAEIESDYVRQDLPQAIASIRSGAERLKNLAASLQNFCHVDQVYPKPADLHECLDSILLLLKSRLSSDIQIVRNYGHLPPVTCYVGQLSQVFMNILTNAVDALINQAVQRQLAAEFGRGLQPVRPILPKPQITITTQVRSTQVESANLLPDLPDKAKSIPERWVSICIADSGIGLSIEQQEQILASFSIEQRAAKETSLAVSYRIITAKHGGQLYLRSHHGTPAEASGQTPTSGTEFEILLPLV